MQALLELIDTVEQAKAALGICARKSATINHKKHGEELTEAIVDAGGFSTNFGGYGSYSRIGLGASFGDRWIVKGFNDPRGKPFTGLMVSFSGTKWDRAPDELSEAITKLGGEVAGSADSADIVVYGGSAPKLRKGSVVLLVDEATFQRSLPVVKERAPAARSTKPLDRETANLWKLLSTRDLATVRQGINLAATLAGGWDGIVADVTVDSKTGALERGSRFSGSGPAQRYLDVALLGLLSVAPDRSLAFSF